MRVTLESSCNNKAHVVEVGEHRFYFSYQTCIAYERIGEAGTNLRIVNHWGPTTGKHFSKLGVTHFHMVSDEVFNDALSAALVMSKAGG